jgi:hypothetical protein
MMAEALSGLARAFIYAGARVARLALDRGLAGGRSIASGNARFHEDGSDPRIAYPGLLGALCGVGLRQ